MLFGNKRTSASFVHNIFHNLGVTCDHGEQNPRGAVRPGAALFPVPQRRRLEAKPRGEFRLAQAQAPSYRTHVNSRHFHL